MVSDASRDALAQPALINMIQHQPSRGDGQRRLIRQRRTTAAIRQAFAFGRFWTRKAVPLIAWYEGDTQYRPVRMFTGEGISDLPLSLLQRAAGDVADPRPTSGSHVPAVCRR